MSPTHDSHAVIFITDLGWMGLVGTGAGMTRLAFGYDSAEQIPFGEIEANSLGSNCLPDWMKTAVSLLHVYATGEPVDLSQIPLAIEHRTPFEFRVRDRLRRIGYGQTISYGELAAAAGAPGAARAVGNIMARNPLPLVIPCHRVLAAGGRIGGFSAPAGTDMKRHLLQLERGELSPSGGFPSASAQRPPEKTIRQRKGRRSTVGG